MLPDCDSPMEVARRLAREKKLEYTIAYALGDRKILEGLDSHDVLKWSIIDDLTSCNSSTLREHVTLTVAGEHWKGNYNKLGQDGMNLKTGQGVEVKPGSVAFGQKDHGRNFNDLTLDKLEEKKDYALMVSSFTHMGQLIYVVEFPLVLIYEHLKKQVIAAVVEKKRRTVARFGYKQYDHDSLIVHYLMPTASHYLSDDNYMMLRSRVKND